MKKLKSILVIIHSPFLDKIPSLKTLLFYLMDNGVKVTVVSPKSGKYEVLTGSHENLILKTVKQRSRKVELPTIVKEVAQLAGLGLNSYDCVIGGDAIGNILARKVAKLKRIPHWFFALEFPQIPTKENPVLSSIDEKENHSLECSDFIITHDQWHEKFLRDNFKLTGKKIFHLPNASLTPPFYGESNYIRNNYKIDKNDIAVLHSGGFHPAFRCKQLIDNYANWPDDIKLIFHTSHKVEDDKYFQDATACEQSKDICFSLKALDNETLDRLVASADVGLALYEKDTLDYRAELMGLAGGKIGNYLKCGVPVIASRMISLSYIEEYGAGFLIDDESQIPDKVKSIIADKEGFRKRSHECYEKLWNPKRYLDAIFEEMSK